MARKNSRVKLADEKSAKLVLNTNKINAKEAAHKRKASDDNTDLYEFGLMGQKGEMAKEAGRQENIKLIPNHISDTPIISVQVDALFPKGGGVPGP